MRRLMAIILLCIFILTMLTSCYDYKELDDLAYVLAIGIDMGVSDKWRITLQFPTMKGQAAGGQNIGGGTSQGSQSDYTYATIDAPSFFTGIDMLNTSVPRRISLLHTKLVAVSEELAKSGKLGEFLTPLIRLREVRRTVHLAVTKGEAMDLIKKVQPYIGTNLSKNYELQLDESFNTGFFPHVTLYDFYNGLKSNYRQPMAILAGDNNSKNFDEYGPKWGDKFKTGGDYTAGELPKESANDIEFFGAALFDGDKMVGELTGEELLIASIARGDFERSFVTIKDPIKPADVVPVDLRPDGTPKMKVNLSGVYPVIDLNIKLKGDILAIESRVAYDEDKKVKKRLESAFSQYIKKKLDKLIEKCQTLGVDSLKFGEHAVWNFATIQEWEHYNWLEKLKHAKVNTSVDFVIKRAGTQIRSVPIVKTGGKE